MSLNINVLLAEEVYTGTVVLFPGLYHLHTLLYTFGTIYIYIPYCPGQVPIPTQAPVLMYFRRHDIWHQRFTPGPEQAKFKWSDQSMRICIYMYIHMLYSIV